MRDEEDGGTRYGVWGYVWTIVIAVLAGLGIILVLVIALLLFILVSRGAVSNYVWLYAVLLFGAFLGYLTLFAFLPIPTTATCGIIRFGVGFSYGICFSVMVILGLLLCKKTELFSSTRVSNIFIAASLILLIAIELVVLVIWLVWTPPGVAYVLYPGFQGPLRTCSHFTLDAGNIIVRTVFENHLLYLIYIMLLILLVLVLAIFIFMRRKYLRASRDKTESYALLAAGIGTGIGTVAIWLTWTLVGALAGPLHNDVHNYGDAALAFGLWFTLTWLLIFLLVQIVNAWRNGSKLKVITREVKTNLSHTNDAHIIAREGDYKQSLTTVDGRVSHPGSVNKMPLILQPNGGTSYTAYEQHVETRTEGKTHGRPAPVPEHAELSTSHKHVFHGGSNFCAECGFAHDPAALHLVHPRSEHSSHNTSLEYNLHTTRPHNTSLDYNLHTTRQEGLLQEPRLATSLQALHLIHPRSRPVSRAGSLDLGHTHLTSHGMNTRVARSEVGSSHGTSGTNVIDLRRPRHHHHNRAYYYPSNYNNNVYFTGHSSKGMSVI